LSSRGFKADKRRSEKADTQETESSGSRSGGKPAFLTLSLVDLSCPLNVGDF